MPPLDTTVLLNWIVSGLIGLIFGSIGAWYTHRLQLKRENLAWQREKEKLQERFEQEKSLLELQFQQKLLELEKQVSLQQSSQVRAEILKGIDNPEEVINRFGKYKKLLSTTKPSDLIVRMMDSFLDKETISNLEEFFKKEQDRNLEALRVSVDEVRKEFDDGNITEQEFKERLNNLIKRTVNPSQNTG